MVKVSVIIAVYNARDYLKRCLDSLLGQTLEDIEIICVNDGSTDGSSVILDEYSSKDNRIKIITQSNAGPSAARNNGLFIAQGEYIGFVDSDDFVEKDFYEKLYNAAKESYADIACASVIRENDKKKTTLIKYNKRKTAHGVKEKFELAGIPKHCYIWNKIYNREKLKSAGIEFINGVYYEDMAYTPNVLASLDTVTAVPDTWYHYWKHPNSVIKKDTDKIRQDKLLLTKKLVELCDLHGIELPLKSSVLKKDEYFVFGIKFLKIYHYRTVKQFRLFGLIPVLTIKERV